MKDDKIYEMLNDAEIDLKEYEVEELSSEEKERYKTRIRMEVKRMNMETRNKKNKSIRKIAAGMVQPARSQWEWRDFLILHWQTASTATQSEN